MSNPASPAPPKLPPGKQGPSLHTGMKKLRKKKRARNMNRALDEFDDVDENDLVAGPSKRVRIGDDYGDGSEDEDEGEDDRGDVQYEDADAGADVEADVEAGADVDVQAEAAARAAKMQKKADPARLEKIATKRKKQAYYLRELCDAEQGKRYDAFVVTSIPKAAVTKLNRDMFDQQVKDDFASILGGLAKIFVAEVVELAKDIQEERGDRGPLTPNHLRLAKARMEDTGLKGKKGMFRR